MTESCIDDDIPICKCVNGPMKDDIAYLKKNYNRNTDEDSNNLSTSPVNNCKTTASQNNFIRTTETSRK